MTKKNTIKFIRENIIDVDYSRRGGTIKVNVEGLFPYVSSPVMGAYQNYLGGGMLGAVVGASKFDPIELKTKDRKIFFKVKEEIKKLFWELVNEEAMDWDEYGATKSYEENQVRLESAY